MNTENLAIKLARLLSSPESILPYREVIKKRDGNISDEQSLDILILYMFAVTRAINMASTSFSDPLDVKNVLDRFHAEFMDGTNDSDEHKKKFGLQLQERYEAYYKILDYGGNFVLFSIGLQFADYFLGRNKSPNYSFDDYLKVGDANASNGKNKPEVMLLAQSANSAIVWAMDSAEKIIKENVDSVAIR